MQLGESDIRGNVMGKDYCLILTDLDFENRLKRFDPSLYLRFNKLSKMWMVLERCPDGTGYNVLIECKHDDGTPKPLGEWVFNRLFVMRHNYEFKRSEEEKNSGAWFNHYMYESERNKERELKKLSHENILHHVDDVNLYKKFWRHINKQPTSDVTAGYRKREDYGSKTSGSNIQCVA